MDKNIDTVFQKRLYQLLDELGITCSELSRQLGVTPQGAHRWLAGKSIPRQATMKKLSKLINKPQSWFYTSSEQETDHNNPPHCRDSYLNPDMKSLIVSTEEELIINIFRELPGEERRKMIRIFNLRLSEINNYIKNSDS